MEDNQITDNDKEDDKQDRIELVQRAVEGDKEAFTNLYMLYIFRSISYRKSIYT